MRRATVGWDTLSSLAACKVDPVLSTARNVATSGQFSSPLFIFEEQHNDATDTSDFFAVLFWSQFKKALEDEKMAWFVIARSVWVGWEALFGTGTELHPKPEDVTEAQDEDDGLVIEMLWNNPEVFTGEFGAESLMAIYGPKY
jgi:hypothetical protein